MERKLGLDLDSLEAGVALIDCNCCSTGLWRNQTWNFSFGLCSKFSGAIHNRQRAHCDQGALF